MKCACSLVPVCRDEAGKERYARTTRGNNWGCFRPSNILEPGQARLRKSGAGGRLARCEPPSVGRVTAAGRGVVVVIVF